MSQPAGNRDEELLSEFAELAMDLARDLHASAKAAAAPGEKARLAQEVHRLGRGLRQTLLVKAKLARDGRAAVREEAAAAREEAKAEAQRRKGEVRRHLARIVVEACETPDEIQDALEELDDKIAEYLPDLQTHTAAEVIEAICRELGLVFAPGQARPWDGAARAEPEPEAPAQLPTGPPDNPWT